MARNKFISREGPTHPGVVIEDYTSFEVYLLASVVFLLGFTLSVVLSTIYGVEYLVWYGWAATLVLASATFFALRAREQRARKAEQQAKDARERGVPKG
jgi:cytosine/uracil/thiamine/allantoin permease